MATPSTVSHSGDVNSEKTYQLTELGRFSAKRLLILSKLDETLSIERELAHATGISLQSTIADYRRFLHQFLGESIVCKSIDILNQYVEDALKELIQHGVQIDKCADPRRKDYEAWRGREFLRNKLGVPKDPNTEALAAIRNAIAHGYKHEKISRHQHALTEFPLRTLLIAASDEIVFIDSGTFLAGIVMFTVIDYDTALSRRQELPTEAFNIPSGSQRAQQALQALYVAAPNSPNKRNPQNETRS